MEPSLQDLLRKLPSVDELLKTEPIREALTHYPRTLVVQAVRSVLEVGRDRIIQDPESAAPVTLDVPVLVQQALSRMEDLNRFTLQPVVNATGIVIHTNLGRSLLAEEAVQRLQILCRSYNNLEYDLERGRRGSRYVHAEALLCELTGAEAALVVNNNAAAVFLVLNTLAKNREVIVSRGQLVEIGGSFRIPDVMTSSGAVLKEVGCTNRTHLRDYEAAVTDATALLMKVHCSNYRVVGFTAEVSLEELVALGRRFGLPVVEDLGSGSLVDLSPFGLRKEPTAQETVRAGADAVTFSGDKLLGGPQAGIILGREEIVRRCRQNPITRALRVDKMTLAALESTLRLYRDERRAFERIPTLEMIALPLDTLQQRAEALAGLVREVDAAGRLRVSVEKNASQVGGGSLPAQDLPTWAVSVVMKDLGASALERALRRNEPPVIGRIESDRLLLDVRTLRPEDSGIIRDAFAKILRKDAEH